MRIAILGTLAAITAGSIVVAQPAPPSAPPGAGHWRDRPAPDLARMRQRRGDDIALLIGLRPEQRPALDAMLAAMEPPHRDWGDRPGGKGADGERPALPPAEEGTMARLDHMSAKIDERGAALKARLDTVRRFYAGLSPDQKQRFDALDRLRHDRRMGGRRGPFGHADGPGRG